jgi:chaperonin GroES
MNTNIQPLHDNIVIRRATTKEETASGIVIPVTADEKPAEGTVIAVGPGKTLPNGTIDTTSVAVGDRVIFGQKAGDDIVLDGEELLVMIEDEIIAILR